MDFEKLKTILDIVIALGGTLVVKRGFKLYKDHKEKQESNRKLLMDKLEQQDKQLTDIRYQLYPNGKMSMFDKLMAGLSDLQAGQVNTWELMDLAVWKSDKDGRVSFVTNSLCEMIGCTVADVLDNSWINRVIENERDAVFKAWQSSVATASEFNRVYTYQKSDGSYQRVSAQAIHNKGVDGKVISSAGRFTKIGEPFKILTHE